MDRRLEERDARREGDLSLFQAGEQGGFSASSVVSAPTAEPGYQALHLALAAGHHNADGGNELEIRQTGALTRAIAVECRRRDIDVRVVTPPEEGLGQYAGRIADVVQQVLDWDRSGWPVDVLLEVHTQASPNPGERGVFAIYPDWGTDADVDVRDRLGPDLARRIAAATGLPVRADGVMSERSTAIGASGYRLAFFRHSVPIADHATRLLIEYGARTNAADLAIQDAPGFAEQAATATVDVLAAFVPRRAQSQRGKGGD